MDEVGESTTRNQEFVRKFSRSSLIKGLIDERVHTPIILDVGAHKGESVRYLRRLFPTALIHSFEPSPRSFAELTSLADERTHCHNVALSDVDGTIDFFSNSISHTNSVFRVNKASTDSIFFAEHRKKGADIPDEAFNQLMRVPAMRLATFCEQRRLEHVHLLKLDVQGAERKVLDGAKDMLQVTDTVIVEIMFFDYYEHQGSFLEIESVLAPLKFRLFSISEISNNPMNGRTDWAEVIYGRVAQQ
jgi:FkbM family methyltransferase